ncbi:MAG: DUF4386 family protein [Anaerolineaceae bacterium]|nr:DUF4386 family protein [Anaerolineaceae bacterium]
MIDLQKMEQEKSVLRWGGLAGLLGVSLFILVWIVVGVFVPPDPADLAGWVTRFPDIQCTRVIENGIYLVALILEIPLFLALYRALRKTSLAPALFGSALGIVGLIVMVASTTPHVAHASLSDLYHAPGATSADQATLALLWQAIWGINDSMLYVGFFVVPIGLILLGVAMLRAPAFGKGLGGMSVVLGVLGLSAAVLQMVDPASMTGAGSYFACLIFYLVLGRKLYSLSKAL